MSTVLYVTGAGLDKLPQISNKNVYFLKLTRKERNNFYNQDRIEKGKICMSLVWTMKISG